MNREITLSDVTMHFKYGKRQQEKQQARANEKQTRRWRTLEQGSKVSCSCTFLHISLSDEEQRRCNSRPVTNAVSQGKTSLRSRFRCQDEVGR